MTEEYCKHCGLTLAGSYGDGLCNECAHKSLLQMREMVGRQQDEIDRLTAELAKANGQVAADYRQYHAYHPYARNLLHKFPWLESAAERPEERR